ncbi:MAG: tRNA (guanine-N7)-methyltransferase, partial [Leptospiraceae bacterium]|nr:tRNA (guanine-N7)-methyltransferase [Leptospiraceae bacterium]
KYVLELGSGWGEFTRKMAQREPANFFLAVEKKLDRILTSTRKQKQEQITNIRYLLLDIAWFFEGVFAPQQFDRVVINFPDPWPKARHHKHRFFSTALAETLANITTPGAVLEFATDDYAYMREAMQVLEKHPQWHNRVAPWHASGSIPNRPQSYFETLHRAEGAPIYFLVYGRAAH